MHPRENTIVLESYYAALEALHEWCRANGRTMPEVMTPLIRTFLTRNSRGGDCR